MDAKQIYFNTPCFPILPHTRYHRVPCNGTRDLMLISFRILSLCDLRLVLLRSKVVKFLHPHLWTRSLYQLALGWLHERLEAHPSLKNIRDQLSREIYTDLTAYYVASTVSLDTIFWRLAFDFYSDHLTARWYYAYQGFQNYFLARPTQALLPDSALAQM